MAVADKIQSKIDEIRRKAGRDVSRGSSAAKRRAREAANETRKRTRQDINRAELAVSKAADDVDREAVTKAAAAAARGAASAVETQPTAPPNSMSQLRQASDARAPVDADIDPSGDPRSIESFARADPTGADGKELAAGSAAGDSLILGDAEDAPGFFDNNSEATGFFGSQDAEDGSELDFEDEFGVGGGGDR